MVNKSQRDKDFDRVIKEYKKIKQELQNATEKWNLAMQRIEMLQNELAKHTVEKMAMMKIMDQFFTIAVQVAEKEGIHINQFQPTSTEPKQDDTPGVG